VRHQLRRHLKRIVAKGGDFLINDNMLFPNPDAESEEWQVKEGNKTVQVPRAVRELRIWRLESRSYENLPAEMVMPEGVTKQQKWAELLEHLKSRVSPEDWVFINGEAA